MTRPVVPSAAIALAFPILEAGWQRFNGDDEKKVQERR
jgi:hypothetical protein